MATNRKAQKETDKAIRHLTDYVDKSDKWAPYYRDLELQIVSPIASHYGLSFGATMERLLSGPYEESALAFLFEEMVTCNWNNEGSVIDEYQEKRGWREGPHGKRYLRALAESDFKLWITTDVVPGEWVDVQRYGTNSKPKRVHERSATEHLQVGQCLAARVLQIGKERNFSGAVLPLTQAQAVQVQHDVDQVEKQTRDIYQQLLDDKEIDHISEEEIATETQHTQCEVLSNTAFGLWAASALSGGHTVMPTIRNTDDEDIVLTKHRLAIQGDVKAIQKTLDKHFEAMTESEWSWLNDQQRLVANIRIKKKYVEIETNSIERGEQGIEKLQSVLGDLIGKPIGVHETLESAMANRQVEPPMSQENLKNRPEVQAQIQDYLQKHYRDSLDQPIPLLEDLSPRECAANPESREKVIHWLKNMELHNLKSGQIFDTSGLWEELGLSSYR